MEDDNHLCHILNKRPCLIENIQIYTNIYTQLSIFISNEIGWKYCFVGGEYLFELISSSIGHKPKFRPSPAKVDDASGCE